MTYLGVFRLHITSAFVLIPSAYQHVKDKVVFCGTSNSFRRQIPMPFVVKLQVHLAHAFAECSAAMQMVIQWYRFQLTHYNVGFGHCPSHS